MKPFRRSFQFYFQHTGVLMLLAITILLPFLLIQYVTVNYVYFITASTGLSIFGDLTDSFLMILFFLIAQLPFIQYVQSELQGEERPLRKAYRTFCEYGFSVFLFALLYVLVVFTGLLVLIVPGVMAMVLFYLTPYITVLKKRTTRHTFRRAIRLGKRHFFSILGLILFSAVVEMIVGIGGMVGVSYITTELMAQPLVQMLLNLFVFPFIIVLFTMFLHKWDEELFEDDQTVSISVNEEVQR